MGVGVLAAGLAAYGAANFLMDVEPVQRVVSPAQDIAEEPAPVVDFSEAAARMVSHRAVYSIEMIEKHSGSQIVNLSGRMYFEWKKTCDAWATDHRFNLVYDYVDSPPMRITSDFATYERQSGHAFDFNSRRRRDGELYEELRGQANITAPNVPGHAAYTMPDTLTFDLPPGTLFPMAHTLAVLDTARSGEKFFNATIFDGSDDQGPSEVNAFIGPMIENPAAGFADSKDIDSTLLAGPAWSIRLAFFPLSLNETGSDYEMNVVFHDNGVISDMVVEYKDFTVSQTLVALEKLDAPACEAAAPATP